MTPVEQVLSVIDTGGTAFLEEQQALEIEQFLKKFADQIASGEWHLSDVIHPDFLGTAIAPQKQDVIRSQGSLESIQGTPRMEFTATAAAFEVEIKKMRAEYSAVDWVKFKIVGIDSGGENSARTGIFWQMAGRRPDGSHRQMSLNCEFEWVKIAGGLWQATRFKAGPSQFTRTSKEIFRDVSWQALSKNASFREQLAFGTELWRQHMDSASGMDVYGQQGLAVGDYDGDGLEDFYITQPGGLPNRLFRNLGNGEFEDTSKKSGLDALDATSAALFADVDNDGTQDLILILAAGQPVLFVNQGRGRFELSRTGFPTGTKPGAVGGCLADYDRDGFIDLYVTSYLWPNKSSQLPRPYEDATNGPPNILYRNLGNRTFVDVTGQVGLNENNNRFSHSCTFGDYDHDGWQDLFVANDFGRKNVYRNQGNGTFRDVTAELGLEDYGAGMSVALGDYDNDGWEDVYFGNMWSSAGRRVTHQSDFKEGEEGVKREIYQRHARGNSLFRSKQGAFDDATLSAGVEFGRWAWCSDFVDFDNDGWRDIYIANGFVTGPYGTAPDL